MPVNSTVLGLIPEYVQRSIIKIGRVINGKNLLFTRCVHGDAKIGIRMCRFQI